VVYEGGDADEHGVIVHVWTLDTAGLSSGEYELRVTAGENVSRSAIVTIVPTPEDAPRPFVNAQSAAPATDVWVAMERARQYRVVGDLDSALVWLRDALERDPDNLALRGDHVELLKSAGLHAELIQILEPAVIDDPNNTELMLDLASAYADAGEHYDAIRYYERSRMVLKQDSPAVLNALANEYLADEQPDKARQLLQRSLELDADQPEIQQMLGRLAVPATDAHS
jgi:tetratricopeptide (TPR) repeat protein